MKLLLIWTITYRLALIISTKSSNFHQTLNHKIDKQPFNHALYIRLDQYYSRINNSHRRSKSISEFIISLTFEPRKLRLFSPRRESFSASFERDFSIFPEFSRGRNKLPAIKRYISPRRGKVDVTGFMIYATRRQNNALARLNWSLNCRNLWNAPAGKKPQNVTVDFCVSRAVCSVRKFRNETIRGEFSFRNENIFLSAVLLTGVVLCVCFCEMHWCVWCEISLDYEIGSI